MSISKKLKLFLYALIFMMFMLLSFSPFKSWATGAGGSANTNITYVDL